MFLGVVSACSRKEIMSAILTWAVFFLGISLAMQDKTPDVAVTCFVSEDCLLPCSFRPSSKDTITWFRQDVVVYKLERDDDNDDDDDEDDDDEDDDDSSSKEHFEHEQLAGRASMFPRLLSRGNARLLLRRTGLKDRGTYRCHVTTSEGEHNAKVILKVEAPIRGLSLELSRLSGYEEMKCTVRHVFPAPQVTWATEPSTIEELQPVTRKLADKQGLYTVDSRLKTLDRQPDLLYICRVTSLYDGQVWTSSLRERVAIRGTQGRDLTIPCSAPPHLDNPLLQWNFSNGEDPSQILSYHMQSGRSTSSPVWNNHVELDGYRVQIGDGSLRLMDPRHSEHTGGYTCVFSTPYNTHTEHTDVTIDDPAAEPSTSDAPSYWWVAGPVVTVLVLVLGLVGLLAYRKKKASCKSRKDPEELKELHSVKDPTGGRTLKESNPLTGAGTKGQSGLQT